MTLSSDTALAAYLALPGQRTFDLADLSLRYLGKELREDAGDHQQLTLDGSGEEESATALVRRASATLGLAAALDEDLARRGATALLHEVELPLVGVLARMERTGIAADAEHFAEMSATLQGEVKAAEQAAYAVVGHEFNLPLAQAASRRCCSPSCRCPRPRRSRPATPPTPRR